MAFKSYINRGTLKIKQTKFIVWHNTQRMLHFGQPQVTFSCSRAPCFLNVWLHIPICYLILTLLWLAYWFITLLFVSIHSLEMKLPLSSVPSRPPQNLWANNISSTALNITWNPVPTGFVHGILRGYRVLYKETNKPSAPYTKITVPSRVRNIVIKDLKKFTNYSIMVLAFTIKGDGAQSPTIKVSTDEDSEYQWDILIWLQSS